MKIRQLAIALLDDDEGISLDAWELLADALEEEGNNDDLINAVAGCDDRVYLPSEWVSYKGKNDGSSAR